MADGKNQHLVLFKDNPFDIKLSTPSLAGGDTGPKEHVETSVAAVAEMLCAAKVFWSRSTNEIVCGHGPGGRFHGFQYADKNLQEMNWSSPVVVDCQLMCT